MKIFITTCLICLLNIVCKAQTDTNTTTGKKVMDRIRQLQAKKIDTIVCYYVKCNGGISVVDRDTCVAYEKNYLVWTLNNKCYMEKFDECRNHKPATVNSKLFRLIRQDLSLIEKEKIKAPEYTYIVKGRPVTYYELVDHSCINFFDFYIGSKILEKRINNFDLDTKYSGDNHLNKNYYHNQKSLLNKLKIVIEKDIKSIN